MTTKDQIYLIIQGVDSHQITSREAVREIYELLQNDTDEGRQLLDFFLWFKENGVLYLDKSIEKMIDIYLSKQ